MYRPGNKIGRYILKRRLGAGGFGEVWAAVTAEDLSREVALKILHLVEEEMPGGGPSTVDRFLDEARVLARFDHPGIVKILEVFDLRPQGPVAYAMEKLEGRSLFALERDLDIESLLAIARQTARTAHFIHSKGILHRDLKSGNIFVCDSPNLREPNVKLIDFGIAKDLARTSARTGTGMLVGTVRAMAPESMDRLNGGQEPLDGAVDQWGLGVTLFRTLSGKPPFDANGLLALMETIRNGPLPPLTYRANYDVHLIQDGLERLIRRLLAKDARQRFASMDRVARAIAELERVLHHEDEDSLAMSITVVQEDDYNRPTDLALRIDGLKPAAEVGVRFEDEALALATLVENRPPEPWAAAAIGGTTAEQAIDPLPEIWPPEAATREAAAREAAAREVAAREAAAREVAAREVAAREAAAREAAARAESTLETERGPVEDLAPQAQAELHPPPLPKAANDTPILLPEASRSRTESRAALCPVVAPVPSLGLISEPPHPSQVGGLKAAIMPSDRPYRPIPSNPGQIRVSNFQPHRARGLHTIPREIHGRVPPPLGIAPEHAMPSRPGEVLVTPVTPSPVITAAPPRTQPPPLPAMAFERPAPPSTPPAELPWPDTRHTRPTHESYPPPLTAVGAYPPPRWPVSAWMAVLISVAVVSFAVGHYAAG